ncbi:MAG: SDR family oxidoreductase [Calditerrivibrio sp.]|nr:SDR family oxidoreductase [Calditerrivibrio sp.]
MTLEGKKILITGASKGIGASLAKKLADKKATLLLTARSMSKATELIADLQKKEISFYTFDADLSKEEDIKSMYYYFTSKVEGLDILINNAGRGIYKPITDETAKTIRDILNLNLFGLIYTTALFSKTIIENRGTIVNIASVAGRKGFTGLSTYCASKWGVVGFSESLRDELCSKNVRVITVEPGLVDTEWGEELPEGFVQYKKSVNMLTPEDVANTIVFALEQPEHVSMNEILIRPTNQPR